MALTYAEALVKTLEKLGVRRIYGVVGDSLNPIVDAVRDSDIEWIHVRNEEAGAFAAGKLKAAEYFLRRELPIVDAKFDLLAAGDRTTLDMRDDWF